MRYGVPDQYLSDYLNYHREMRFNKLPPFGYSYKPIGSFTLPNIDTVFDEQNRKLADTVYEVDKLLLPIVFNSLSEAEQRFIEQSKVDKVRVQFNAQDTWIPHSALIVVGELTPPESLVFHIPDRIDLLQCTLNGEERIYALETNKDNGNYKMRRVDRDRQALLWLLDDITVPSRDPDYKLRVTSHTTLKSCAESPQTLMDNLAEHHRKRLLTALTEKGYDKTTQEKVVDFMLGLIPFYTCITEGLKGNEREAIPACMFDVINLIPFAGQAAVTGFRFGRALAGSTAMALRYGARQATIKGMLKQTGKTLIPLFPPIAQEISAQVAKGLGSGFLRSVDPGFELLASGGAKGIRAMRNILTKMPTKSKGLIRLSDALGKKSAGLSSVPDNTNLMIESVFSPAHGRYLDVTVVGEERSKRIWAQINRETGEVFGQRFTLDGNGNLEAIESRLNQQSVEARGPSLSKPSAKKTVPKKDALDGRLTKYTISEIKNYALMNNLIMFKHHIPDSHYIQYYTKSPGTKKGSEVLVVSAHGGFRDRDTLAPVVVLPSDITIQMLTPHGTRLKDPTLDHVVNGWKYLRTYVTITKGKVRKVDFLPQQGHSQWHYDDSYDPTDKYNTLGRVDGLQNYRHIRFEGESDMLIANVLIKNRELAKMGKADLTDVLTVDTRITEVSETSLEKASVQRVLELDREGKLTNEKGHRYKRIAFCHCRCRVEPPFDLTSSYYMVPMDLENMMEQAASKGSKISEVEMTVLHREDVNSEFAIQRYTIGRFIFTAVNQIDQSTVSPLESDPFSRG